jgi:hypothetical protein
MVCFRESEDIGQHSSSARTVIEHQRHTVKSANGVLDRNVATAPRRLTLRLPNTD